MHTWTRYTTAAPEGLSRPTDSLELGPGEVAGLDRRLLGDVKGMRILELGAGAGHSSVALASMGARVVAIDPDPQQVALARAAADTAEVHVEVHQADLADLAFLPADAFDAVVSVHALASVSDLGRIFRQTHRLLKADRPIVVTLPHPSALMVDPKEPATLTADYAASEILGEGAHRTHRHGIAHVFTQLHRSNFRIDTMIEPRGEGLHPASIIFRARKIGT